MTPLDVFHSWPKEVKSLIDEVQTVEALDVLCCTARDPSRSWNFDQLVAHLGLDRARVTEAVVHLVGKGFLKPHGVGTVRYAEAPERDAAVKELVHLSETDRPNVLAGLAHVSIWKPPTSFARSSSGVAPPSSKFGVLLLGDFTPQSARQADRLRSAAIPAWTANTDFEVNWLLQRALVEASVTLVDLRRVNEYRDKEVERFAALALEAMLPTVLVGARDEESNTFPDVVAKLPADATHDDVVAAISALKLSLS